MGLRKYLPLYPLYTPVGGFDHGCVVHPLEGKSEDALAEPVVAPFFCSNLNGGIDLLYDQFERITTFAERSFDQPV